jgi:hypothetical protein
MFQLVLRKQFVKLEKEVIHCLNAIAFAYRWILLLDIYNFVVFLEEKSITNATFNNMSDTMYNMVVSFIGVICVH